MIELADIREAAQRLQGQVLNTPCVESRTLSQITGAQVFLKFENLQFTASFKERGACNKLAQLSSSERKRGVVAMSAGNHAQGVAYHAQRLGLRAVIVMPRFTPGVKVERTRSFGAEVVLDAVPALDVLVVAVGGGGLIAGIAVAAKGLKPDIEVIGVQALRFPNMFNA